MSGNLLFETSKWRDIVELGLCMAIYDVCNDNQFDNCTPLDFANFLNVRERGKGYTCCAERETEGMLYGLCRVADHHSKKEALIWF